MQRTSSATGTRSSSLYSSPSVAPSSPQHRRSTLDGVSSIPRRTPSSTHSSSTGGGGLAQHMVQSMTIEEMRALHHRALAEADAKRQELRLVLASRYRELVGSSDEVVHMRDRALELQTVVQALPQLIGKVSDLSALTTNEEESKSADPPRATGNDTVRLLRQWLLDELRSLFRALDAEDVFAATLALRNVCTGIASSTRAHALANALSWNQYDDDDLTQQHEEDTALELQMRVIGAQIQQFPGEIRQLAQGILARHNAAPPGAALVSLYLLGGAEEPSSPEQLIILYYQAKTQSVQALLEQLSMADDTRVLQDAKDILSQIVVLLQQDIIVYPYQMFVQRSVVEASSLQAKHWPFFDAARVQHHCSQYVYRRGLCIVLYHISQSFHVFVLSPSTYRFLVTHLPLIQRQVKSVLVTIAGTTASALGQMRQTLYDQTDGSSRHAKDWEAAVSTLVDRRTVLAATDTHVGGDGALASSEQPHFSLWAALFSNTFSSLVHSILSTSFSSVHTSVIHTLRDSLSRAPAMEHILPHEAYRNTLHMALALDRSLLKVSADAHELLVHAEERVESERRLRQSLYVQTCEIMGRLLCELRRMATERNEEEQPEDATGEWIIGRLCYLLQFQLTSLPTLLSPDAAPTQGGMISYIDLQSAFELADDNQQGWISVADAMEAVNSAFSGTPFHGEEMVRGTLSGTGSGDPAAPGGTVTLAELTLWTARGLRHEGDASALGTVQRALESLQTTCGQRWARAALTAPQHRLRQPWQEFMADAATLPEEEWQRLLGGDSRGISPWVVGFVLDVAVVLNVSVCPADATPRPTTASLMDHLRKALCDASWRAVTSLLSEFTTAAGLEQSAPTALRQLYLDVSWLALVWDQPWNDFLPGVEALGDATHLSEIRQRAAQLHARIGERSQVFLESLLGPLPRLPDGTTLADSDEPEPVAFRWPLASSRRFALLPVPVDHRPTAWATEVRKEEPRPNESATRSGGFGFLSSMLKTTKK
jgi:Vps51/Vps67